MIEFRNIKKIFPNKTLYNSLSFKINDGDFFAILGKSGTGKSTLLNIISFFEFISEGEYLFDGVPITQKNSSLHSEIRNQKIGFIFQNYNLLEGYTGYDNIMLPSLYTKSQITDERLSVLIDRLGIAPILEQRVDFLSGGEKQRIAVARALITDPSIIIADEPTGNLDPSNSDFVISILEEEHKKGKTIIFVTHTDRYEYLYTNKLVLS